MKLQFLIFALLLMGISTSFAEELKEQQITSTYTMHLKNNSSSSTVVKVKKVPLGGDCAQSAEEATMVVGSQEIVSLNCSATKKESYCINCPERKDDGTVSSWLQLDCATHNSSDLNLNLFGR